MTTRVDDNMRERCTVCTDRGADNTMICIAKKVVLRNAVTKGQNDHIALKVVVHHSFNRGSPLGIY